MSVIRTSCTSKVSVYWIMDLMLLIISYLENYLLSFLTIGPLSLLRFGHPLLNSGNFPLLLYQPYIPNHSSFITSCRWAGVDDCDAQQGYGLSVKNNNYFFLMQCYLIDALYIYFTCSLNSLTFSLSAICSRM